MSFRKVANCSISTNLNINDFDHFYLIWTYVPPACVYFSALFLSSSLSLEFYSLFCFSFIVFYFRSFFFYFSSLFLLTFWHPIDFSLFSHPQDLITRSLQFPVTSFRSRQPLFFSFSLFNIVDFFFLSFSFLLLFSYVFFFVILFYIFHLSAFLMSRWMGDNVMNIKKHERWQHQQCVMP